MLSGGMKTCTILMTILLVLGIIPIMNTLNHVDFILAQSRKPKIYGCITLNYDRIGFMSPCGMSSWRHNGLYFDYGLYVQVLFFYIGD